MTNNDIFEKLCKTFHLDETAIIDLFKSADREVDRDIVTDWLKNEKDRNYKEITDQDLATFLNGLINQKRGKRENVSQKAETVLTNNMILRKLKIALNLQSEDIIALLASEGKKISPHQLSAFFRNPTHSKYQKLNDQYLRNFLQALQKTRQ